MFNFAKYFEDVYKEKEYAEYIGGTFCFKIQDGEIEFCNLDEERWTIKERYWLAMCYVKYKGEKSYHFYEALSILKKNLSQKEITKILIKK